MRLFKKKVIDSPLPVSKEVTSKTREDTVKESRRFRGSVRISCGKFWSDKEFESYRERILSTPLP
jgi:hypothetical protein